MANIRVTCPACKSELELDAAFEGQEVECGNCLEVFKAARPGSGGSSGGAPPADAGSGRGKIPGAGTGSAAGSGRGRPERRPAPRSRRRDDDYEDRRRRDDDYDDDDYGPPPPRRSGAAPGDGVAIASLVLGIISIVVCCCYPISLPLGLSAAICGGLGLKSENNRSMAVVGMTLGILTLCLVGGMFLIGVGNAALNPNRFN